MCVSNRGSLLSCSSWISWVGADVWTCLFIPIESADVIQKKVESRVTLKIIYIASSEAIGLRQQCMIKQGSWFVFLKKGGDRPLFALNVIEFLPFNMMGWFDCQLQCVST